VFTDDQAALRRQQELLSLVSESKHQRLVFAFDRPLYCSALTEQCTQTAGALRHLYEAYFPSSSLVVSGYRDAYERTFPKRDQRYQEFDDPSDYVNPELPSFINVNGLHGLGSQWLQQK